MRVPRFALVIVLALGALGGCGNPAEEPQPTRPTVTTVSTGDADPLDGFREVTVTVVDADGTTRTFCLLLADTPERQQQGLMHVTDPGLNGHDGMVFSYDQDIQGAFWMRNTRLPLSIAFIRADGTTQSTTDMEPCPDEAPTCPTYPPGGPYRFAIEVPQGRLDDLGISDRSRVTLGEEGC